MAPSSDDEVVFVSYTRAKSPDVEFVSHMPVNAAKSVQPMVPLKSTTETAAEVVHVVEMRRGVKALVDYPHMRFQCGVYLFSKDPQRHCSKCFCYVCDKPAKDCVIWNEHATATDKVPRWRMMRRGKRVERLKSLPNATLTTKTSTTSLAAVAAAAAAKAAVKATASATEAVMVHSQPKRRRRNSTPMRRTSSRIAARVSRELTREQLSSDASPSNMAQCSSMETRPKHNHESSKLALDALKEAMLRIPNRVNTRSLPSVPTLTASATGVPTKRSRKRSRRERK